MRKILAAGVMLAGMLGGGAQAAPVYNWEADCIDRIIQNSWEAPIHLGCRKDKVKGTVTLWDEFQPNVFYENDWPWTKWDRTVVFKVHDSNPRFNRTVVFDEGHIGVELPSTSGAGTLFWVLPSADMTGERLYLEWDISIKWENMIFTRVEAAEVPEPSSLALLGVGLLGVLGARRRSRS